jgi:hypothetical protein
VDIGWTRDQNTVHIIEYAARFPKLFVCCPRICAIEFKRVTQSEVQSLKRFRENFNKVFSEIKRLDEDGFISTSYITDRIKKGEIVWKKD